MCFLFCSAEDRPATAAHGRRQACRKEELTRALLLEYLKSQGAIEEMKGLVEVTVQVMVGASFGVMLKKGGGSNSNVL